MESVSHSRQPNKVSVKKINSDTNNNGGFSAKTLYDDVYGGPPKFGSTTTLSPRFEDYNEIFSSFHAPRASSIPVLDLPPLDDAEVFFGSRSDGFDYAEVFGGFNGSDFSFSYEELFRQPDEPDGVFDEEEEEEEEQAWYECDHCLRVAVFYYFYFCVFFFWVFDYMFDPYVYWTIGFVFCFCLRRSGKRSVVLNSKAKHSYR